MPPKNKSKGPDAADRKHAKIAVAHMAGVKKAAQYLSHAKTVSAEDAETIKALAVAAAQVAKDVEGKAVDSEGATQ